MIEQAGELTQGDALARVAVLEAEVAELRGRVCVPDGCVVVPLSFVKSFRSLAHNYSLTAVPPEYYDGRAGDAFKDAYARCGRDLRNLRAQLAAAPAPVERVELMTWPQAVDRAARLIDEEQERLTAEGYFMDSDDCCDVLRESVGTPQPPPTAAQDVTGLVEALEWCEKWFSRHSPTAALISGEHATHPMLSSIRAALAAHQSGGAK